MICGPSYGRSLQFSCCYIFSLSARTLALRNWWAVQGARDFLVQSLSAQSVHSTVSDGQRLEEPEVQTLNNSNSKQLEQLESEQSCRLGSVTSSSTMFVVYQFSELVKLGYSGGQPHRPLGKHPRSSQILS